MSRSDGHWGRTVLEYCTLTRLRVLLREAANMEKLCTDHDPVSVAIWRRRIRRIERVMRDRGFIAP